MRNSKKYMRSGIALFIIGVVASFLSFIKEAIFGAWYGVSSQADAYVVAIQIPIVLFAVFAVSIKTIVIPLYSEKFYKEDEDVAKAFASNLLNITLIISISFAILGMLLADYVVYLFAPGFDEKSHNLAVNLVRIILPSVVFTAPIHVYRGILNVHKVFVTPSFAIYFQNIVIILFIMILSPFWGIYAATIGTLVGIVIQFLYVFLLVQKRFQYNVYVNLKDQQIIKAGKMVLPVMLGIGVAQINQIVSRIVASYLVVGSIAALNYASKLSGVFGGLITQAVSIIVYPLYAECAAKGQQRELNNLFNKTLSIYTIILLPIICGMIIYREELVRIAFARGMFDARAVELTQYIFGFYAIGLLFFAIRDTAAKVYYSMGDTRTPMINSAIGVCLNIVLNVILARKLGAGGLALATSISAFVICMLLMIDLRKRIQGYSLHSFGVACYKSFFSVCVMLLVVVLLNRNMPYNNDMLVVFSGTLLGMITYAVLLVLLRTKEFSWVLGTLFQKHKVRIEKKSGKLPLS